MDWNGNFRVPFVSPPETSFSFLYNYNYDQFPETMKQPSTQTTTSPTFADRHIDIRNMTINHEPGPKKKRLSNEQLELLEKSFQEEVKLGPDRKMRLAKELGLQPRQISVWFQNRRARWKSKQLEGLYFTLKQEYDAVTRDIHGLQQEVLALRTILKDQVGKKQLSEISGDETAESTSIPSSSENPRLDPTVDINLQQITNQCNNPINDEANNNNKIIMPPYWADLPSCS